MISLRTFLARERKAIRMAAFARRNRPLGSEGNEKSILKGGIFLVPGFVALATDCRPLADILFYAGIGLFLAWMGWCVWHYEKAVAQRNRRARKIVIRQGNQLLPEAYYEPEE